MKPDCSLPENYLKLDRMLGMEMRSDDRPPSGYLLADNAGGESLPGWRVTSSVYYSECDGMG